MTDRARPGLVALYDIRPGNGAGQFLQPRSPHGALTWEGVVPILEWTQVSIALGDFVKMFNSGMGLLEFPGLGFAGHYNQGGCAFEADVLSLI